MQTPTPIAVEKDRLYLEGQLRQINNQRIFWLAVILVVIHLIHVVLFWPYTPDATDTGLVWRNGIILLHAIMTVVGVGIAGLGYALERNERLARRMSGTVFGLVSLIYLLFGGALAVVDQLVTSSINPLLMASTAVAVTILIRPWIAAVNYTALLACFNLFVGWTQRDPEALLSVRVNSMTATGVGFGIALLLWRTQVLAIRQQQQIEEQKKELEERNKELALLASQDALTGLPNRAQFLRMANQELCCKDGTGRRGCLIMVDVDHFKKINDTYGHPVGDSVLRSLSQLLVREVDNLDTLARMGGEEFSVLLPGASLRDGMQLAERLRTVIEQHAFVVDTHRLQVTGSFGVAELVPERNDTLHQLYLAADAALYKAKAEGRNCVRSA